MPTLDRETVFKIVQTYPVEEQLSLANRIHESIEPADEELSDDLMAELDRPVETY